MASIRIMGKENVEKGIKAIAQNLLEKVDDITNDLDQVQSITIHALLGPGDICNFDITKNYLANFEEEKENNNE